MHNDSTDHPKTCCKCRQIKDRSEFGACVTTKDGLNHACRPCHNAYRRNWGKNNRASQRAVCNAYLVSNPDFRLWSGAKCRAKQNGRPFAIKRTDIVIPAHCPILGIKLEFGKGKCCDASPSLDAIIPEKGYVPGNIAVISHRANTIKTNATVEEIRKVADWLEKVTQSESPSFAEVCSTQLA